jgi:hypothetical protein
MDAASRLSALLETRSRMRLGCGFPQLRPRVLAA